jgi:hypothetical protein
MTTVSSLCTELLGNVRTAGEKNIDGTNLSPYPAIGIFFNGYGEDEDTGESTDLSVEKYKIVIHKNSTKPKFILTAEDRTQIGTISSDSAIEVEINAIYDLQTKSWHINDFLSEEFPALTGEEVIAILKKLLSKSKTALPKPASSDWPFAVAPIPTKRKI